MRRSRRGASAIEFALLLVPITLILGGIIEFGWLFLQSNTLLMAARTGARSGAAMSETGTTTPGTAADDAARATLTMLNMDPAAVTINACVTSITVGTVTQRAVVVTISRPYNPLTGLLGGRLVGVDLTESAVMLLEQEGPLGSDNC